MSEPHHVVLVLDLSNALASVEAPHTDRIVARAAENVLAVLRDGENTHISQVAVHRSDQRTHHALVVELAITPFDRSYALVEILGREGDRAPQIDRAVASSRHQVVVRLAEHHRVHAGLVGRNGLEVAETSDYTQREERCTCHSRPRDEWWSRDLR